MRAALIFLPVATILSSALPSPQPGHSPQHTYVIVHGAWGGGWDWRAVDSLLTLRGHRVLRVTLTGLGERVHLASPSIGLDTHIDDVVNTILWEDFHDVVLVGHSYGGMVITGVADRIPNRIRRLVYIDAFLPDSGETALGLVDTIRGSLLRTSRRNGFSVPDWVSDTASIPRDVPQPLRTFTDTLRLVNAAARALPATYILTVEPTMTPDPFQRFADRAASRGWPVYRLEANHTPERSARQPLVALLAAVP
jgi:pimeloyl-ACP methyl ester carboxylesterase